MSKYEWERGTIILPSAEFARARQAVQKAATEHRDTTFGLTQEFWKSLTPRQKASPEEYRKAHYQFFSRRAEAVRRTGVRVLSSSRGQPMVAPEQVVYDAQGATTMRYGQPAPKRVLASDMPAPTNRDTAFSNGDASVTFDKERSSVTWEVWENNHAVDTARQSALWAALHEALSTVKWTSRTGGVIAGNDEYRQEQDWAGGGGNYVTAGYGPVGAAEAGAKSEVYTDTAGRTWLPQTTYGRSGPQHSVIEAVPVGLLDRRDSVLDGRGRRWAPKSGAKPKNPCPPQRPRPARTGQGRVGAGRPDGGQFTARGYADPGELVL